jgi:hypothetical protein
LTAGGLFSTCEGDNNMSEPAGPVSFSLLGAAVALAGPVLGPYALIVFAAMVGALLALSKASTDGHWAGLRYVALASAIALLITGPICWALATYLGVPANIALIPVAFLLGAKRDALLDFLNQLLDAAAAAFTSALDIAAKRGRGGE